MWQMALVVPWFVPRTKAGVHVDRYAELVRAQGRNMQNPRVQHPVHLAVDDVDWGWLLHNGAPPLTRVHRYHQRPSFADLFELASRLGEASTGYACVANADVWFDQSLDLLDGRKLLTGEVLAISRDDVPQWRERSQDAWVFEVPLRLPGLAGVVPGTPGCDNRLAWELQHTALRRVVNPCEDIALHHEHQTKFRTYQRGSKRDLVPPPHMHVAPGRLPWG